MPAEAIGTGPTNCAAALQEFMNLTRRVSSFFLMHRAGALVLPLLLATLVASCGESQQQGGAPPPPAVTVAKPIKRTVFDYDEYVGRFTAINSVEVRARVSGYLDGLHFKDGQLVKQGDLLFTIDKRPFQNTLDQARANLVQAQSNVAFTESDYTRGQQLVRDKTITDQTFEQRAQAFRNAKASVSNNEAAVRQAELDIEFTELRAPVNGRIGDRRVSPGNLVTGGTGGNTTLLATIVSTDPIYFEFTFDEASYLRYERLARNGGHDVASRGASVPVALKLIDENDFDHKGRMDFVDNVIDRSTGTIRGRAVFDNPNDMFTPGMFARVRVPGSPPYEGLLVPDAAIGTEQARRFVIVIDAQDTVADKVRDARATHVRQFARHQGWYRARRPHRRQRTDAGAARPEGDAGGAGREARPGRSGRRAATGQVAAPEKAHAHFALLHRPADFRVRGLDRFRDPRRRGILPPADRAISGNRTADHHGVRPVSRRQCRRRGLDGGDADRAADQRRREHDLSVVEFDRRRPVHDFGQLRHRHQSRYRAGAGAEPRGHRAAAPAGRRAQYRRHGQQEFTRPDDGRASLLAG